ncbi:MAG: HAMP domain-containing histidine kinase [Planctomycetes bacterium]|nr:HAMP domain-containing histidine kinase [Planctomycetota bacterium]
MKPWRVWLVFAVSLGLLLWAARWIHATILELDQAQAELRRQERVQELALQALWRMEYAVEQLIVQEAARPAYHYYALYAAERGFTDLSRSDAGRAQVEASPLLTHFVPYTIMHFSILPDSALSSPHVPKSLELRALAESRFGAGEVIAEGERRLEKLRALFKQESLSRVIVKEELSLAGETGPAAGTGLTSAPASTLFFNLREFQSRRRHVRDAQLAARWDRVASQQLEGAGLPAVAAEEGMIRPYWCGSGLFLARPVMIGGEPTVQGCWLDWPAIRERFLSGIEDLLPNAEVVPVLSARSEGEGLELASLPVRLVPGEVAGLVAQGTSPVRFSLYLALGSLLVAAAAAAVLLRGVLLLSERRGAFVSAVTHELRTPLTTLNMYAELLLDGRIKTEEKKALYLETMRKEAGRLGRLVENVLAFSRLENVRPAAERREVLSVSALLARFRERVAERAALAGMTVEEDMPAEIGERLTRADVAATEQIIFNLVDNACKYAARSDDRRILVQVAAAGRKVAFRVRDFGPGILPSERRRLFRPFSKSAREAARTQPGVGLGLALCRRLARGMGGDLAFDREWTRGAGFTLTLQGARGSAAGGSAGTL